MILTSRKLTTAALLVPLFCASSVSAADISAEKIHPAESPSQLGTAWKSVAANATTPAHIVAASVGSGTATAEATYRFTADHSAIYKVWMRVRANGDAADTFFWSLDGTNYTAQWAATTGDWTWVVLESNGRVFKKGVPATLYLRTRETGLQVDSIIVTSLPGFKPTSAAGEPTPALALPSGSWAAASKQPISTRPRVFVNADDVSSIKGRLSAASSQNDSASTLLKSARARMTTWADGKGWASGTIPSCKDRAKYVQGNALEYLLADVKQGTRASQAYEGLLTYIDSCVPVDMDQKKRDTRATGMALTLMALIYDWCNDWVVANGKQDTLQRRFLELAPLLEIGFPPTNQGAIVGHGSEAQVLRDQLSAAIAFYDEGAAINKVYDIVAGRVLDTYVPARNYIYQSKGMPQGTDYGPYRHQWDLFSALLFRAIGHPNIYSSDQRYVIHQNLYLRRPDKQYMRDGDVHKSSSTEELSKRTWKEQMPFLLSANLYNDPVAQFGLMRALPEWEDDLWVVLYFKPSLRGSDAELSLTAMHPDPLGMMIARTGWEHSASRSPVIATMKLGSTFFGNHQHFDAGHFQIYYKGALAIDSGAYNVTDAVGGLKEYGSKHRNNYSIRTVAHNAMLLYDEDEMFGSLESNDGGQTYSAAEPATLAMVLECKRATTVAYAIGQRASNTPAPEYSYLKGDLKGAYGGKATHYVRSFAFLNFDNDTNPAALVVFDRLAASKTTTKKRWLLHSINAPSVDSNRRSVTFTIDSMLNDNQVTGKLVHQALLPDSPTMTIWGEKDHEEFIVDNRDGTKSNWDYVRPAENVKSWEEPGRYRVELQSDNATTAPEIFLNIMQVMDGNAAPYTATKFGDSNFVGVAVADRAVMFSVAQSDFNGTTSFQLPGSGTTKLLITDLVAGNWTLTKAGSPATTHVVQAGQGVLYATVTAGASYSLKKSN